MKFSRLSILVTGGAGFIGSHTAIALAKNNSVTVFDSFDSSVRTAKELSSNGIRVVKGDILNATALDRVMKNCDIVFNFAIGCVRLSLQNPRLVHEINTTGTLGVLMSAKKNNVKRMILISSSEIYGTAGKPIMDEHHPANPTTVYGMSKYISELYGKLYNQQFGLPVTIIRPFNTYGPYSHFDGVYGEVIPRFAIRAISGLPPVIFGSGKQTRDFTYITDTVNGIIQAAGSDRLVGDIVNIARAREVSVETIAKLICREARIPYAPIMMPPRPNDVARHAADIAKAKRILGFTPTVSIEDGLKLYMKWLQSAYPDPKQALKLIPDKNW